MTKKTKNKIVLKGNQKVLEKLQKLRKSGELEKLFGASISDISSWEQLSQWFNNISGESWRQPEHKCRSCSIPEKTDSVTRSKQIELEGCKLELVITMKPGSHQKTDIRVKVKPNNIRYLPEGLQLEIIDEARSSIDKVQAQDKDNFLQLRLRGENEDKFSLRLNLGDSDMTENFVI